MAPLFTAFVIVPGAALLLAVAFAVARFFQPASVAIRIALVFGVGSAIGGVATLVGLAFLVSSTLSEPWQVLTIKHAQPPARPPADAVSYRKRPEPIA